LLTSAHIDNAESENVLRSDHSTQEYPEKIKEVRRSQTDQVNDVWKFCNYQLLNGG